MWTEGTIGIPNGDGKYTAVKYWVKHFEEPSDFGIKGGRMSKLTLSINGKIVCSYERGWDVRPTCDAARAAYKILLKEYN